MFPQSRREDKGKNKAIKKVISIRVKETLILKYHNKCVTLDWQFLCRC